MRERKAIIFLSVIAILLASIILAVNYYIYKYPGNNYFPSGCWYIAPILVLIYWGCCIQFGSNSYQVRCTYEIAWFYFILTVIDLFTNAVQFTPFKPIDSYIVDFEKSMYIDLLALISWTSSKNTLLYLLKLSYDSLTYQMVLLPIFVIFMSRKDLLNEYYFLLLVTLMLGFGFYYFFPTTGPASVFSSNYFSEYQLATGAKFFEIHKYIQPTTIEGGLIALPSFHTIWACLCLYLVREWKPLFYTLIPINILLISSCVLLGWHYPSDLFASFMLLLLAHGLLIMHRSSSKWCKSSCKDHAAIE
ncbi:MAG: phosphatase PAP2 family protein [Legionellaceae bacterium]|nr:phosphatase PAP2 family protein [Legionellaceae bacterium]